MAKYDAHHPAPWTQTNNKNKGYYTVQNGDSWESIAGKVYGNQREFLKLMQLNGGSLKAGDVIKLARPDRPGQQPFISNQDAAALGYGTSTQVAQAYQDNGTGGYKSGRLPLGGMGSSALGSQAPQPATAKAFSTPPAMGSSLLNPTTGGNSGPLVGNESSNTPITQAAQAGQANAAAWTQAQSPAPKPGGPNPAAINQFPSSFMSGIQTGPGNAQQWAGANPPQTDPNVGNYKFNPIPAIQNGPGGDMANRARWIQQYQKTNNTPTMGEAIFGRTTPPVGATVSGQTNPAAQSSQSAPSVQYSPQTIQAAVTQLASGGQVSQSTYNVAKQAYVADGGDPAAFDKAFGNKVSAPFNPDTQLPASASTSSTGSGDYNTPTGYGYTSPSGYFVPYARKTQDQSGIYDPGSGFHSRRGGGAPVSIGSSNLTTGLINWRYGG